MRIATLNLGRCLGKDPYDVSPTLAWVKGVGSGAISPPAHVLCLQDVPASVLGYLWQFQSIFVPMTDHLIFGRREPVGIAIVSTFPLVDRALRFTHGDGILRDLQGVGNDNQRIEPSELADQLVLETESRVVLAATVMLHDGRTIRVATHHGFWTRGGVHTDLQRRSTGILGRFLHTQGMQHGGVVFAADTNTDRGGEVIASLQEWDGRDFLPAEIQTTLAPHHPAAKFGAKPDRIMVFSGAKGYPFSVENFRLDFSPGSDHGMLIGDIV